MAEKQYKVDLNMTGNQVKNVADGSAASDAVNLSQLQSYARGATWKDSVRVASTGNVTVAGPGASIDGVTLSNGDRVLLKNQSTGSQNGIYIFNGAASAMTRASDNNSSANYKAGNAVLSTEGTANADKAWIVTTDGTIVVGTTSVTWSAFGGGTTYTAGNGIDLTANAFSVKRDAGSPSIYVGVDGIAVAAEFAGNGTTITSGVLNVGAGTGISVAADTVAVDTSLVARWKSATAGNGSSTALVLTHNLNNPYHIASVQDASTGEEFEVAVTKTANSTTFTFQTAPATNSVVLVVVG